MNALSSLRGRSLPGTYSQPSFDSCSTMAGWTVEDSENPSRRLQQGVVSCGDLVFAGEKVTQKGVPQ